VPTSSKATKKDASGTSNFMRDHQSCYEGFCTKPVAPPDIQNALAQAFFITMFEETHQTNNNALRKVKGNKT
jgi:hypothetical protein